MFTFSCINPNLLNSQNIHRDKVITRIPASLPEKSKHLPLFVFIIIDDKHSLALLTEFNVPNLDLCAKFL